MFKNKRKKNNKVVRFLEIVIYIYIYYIYIYGGMFALSSKEWPFSRKESYILSIVLLYYFILHICMCILFKLIKRQIYLSLFEVRSLSDLRNQVISMP